MSRLTSLATGRSGFRAGAVIGAVPQALLCGAVVYRVAIADDPADPVLYGLYVVLVVFIVAGLVSVTAGLLCLIRGGARPFGQGLLLGTGCGALALIVLALVAVPT